MVGGWIHNFAVTDTQTHKGGYTIYKITSVVFPRSIPQALTCLTVWKRFHDVKRLHREIKRRHKNLRLSGILPEPTDCSFFKRFDANIISRRRAYILELLDFVALHPALYKSHGFTQFFNDGLSPTTSPMHHQLHQNANTYKNENDDFCNGETTHRRPQWDEVATGAIAEICDKLDLLYDNEELTLVDPERDKVDAQTDDNSIKTTEQANKCKADEQVKEQQQVNAAVDDNSKQVGPEKPCKDYTRFLTPMASIESDDSDYIYEAALEFSHAVEAEANLEYKEAHLRYKRGVEVLLNGSKDDGNDERKYIAKTKITKYLARADDIYDKFLSDNVAGNAGSATRNNFQLSIDVSDNATAAALYIERPWNNLVKYKVLQVLGESVMQVQCITEPQRPIYIMKGIEKPPSNTPAQNVFLPQHIPFMVDLLAFFQSEQKIFLLLKQAEGGLLCDYLRIYTPSAKKSENYSNLFPEVANACDSVVAGKDDASNVSVQDSGFMNCHNSNAAVADKSDVASSETSEFSELVRSSQQLLRSVSNTLKEVHESEETSSNKALQVQQTKSPVKSPAKTLVTNRKIPEASLKQWARELAVAINALHTKGIILRDLHMENLLLGAKGQLLLTYFYQNEGFVNDNNNYIHKAFSPKAVASHFVAPERMLTFKSDWWSYGVVLYELLLGLSFKATHPGHLDLYGCVQYPETVDLSDSARDLLDNLLQQDSQERYDYEQIQKHTFFKGTNWAELEMKSNDTQQMSVIKRQTSVE